MVDRPGVHRCAQVGTSLRECALVYAGVCGSAWVSTSVCGMNSQNMYWKIESLHQRTLIHILYEFLIMKCLVPDTEHNSNLLLAEYKDSVFGMPSVQLLCYLPN